jgi:hypothetical protein
MNLNFTTVSYDGDISDFSEDELKQLVREFESAQDSNAAEFETAAEAIDEVDSSNIEDFEKARTDLIESITDAEAFDEVPLSSDALEDCDFSELEEWQEFVADSEDEDEEENEGEEDGTFSDMGQESPVEGENTDFADETLSQMPGLNLD